MDHPDKILELGDSIDIGKCKETKKDGSGCTNLVRDILTYSEITHSSCIIDY